MLLKFDEFNLSVRPLGDRYLIRTENAAPGVPVAEETFHWPIESWLEQANQLMSNPMMLLLQGNHPLEMEEQLLIPAPSSNPPTAQFSQNLAALGQQLHNALFQGSIRDSWLTAQGIAHNHRAILRLRLGLGGEELLRLPWEVLHVGEKQGYGANFRPLATGTDVTFSRYQLNIPVRKPRFSSLQTSHHPLKILMAIASPSDQESLELRREAEHLQEELQKQTASGSGSIELTVLEQPGREQLTQALEQGNYQVFHYSGHSSSGELGGAVNLVSRDTNLTEKLSGNDLAGLLVNNGIKLAIFNSCRSANIPVQNAAQQEQNLAQALVNRGIPAVLAMAEQIPDEVALTLTRLLYRNINQGYPIDLSLSRARQGLITGYGSDTLYWALPVIYQHPQFDGVLIRLQASESGSSSALTMTDEESTAFPQETYRASSNEINTSPVQEDDAEDFIKNVFNELATTETETQSLTTQAESPALVTQAPTNDNVEVEEENSSSPVIVRWGTSDHQKPIKWFGVGLGIGLGIVAIAVGGILWMTSNRSPQGLKIGIDAPPVEIPTPSSFRNSRKDLDNTTLKRNAIKNFLTGNIQEGQLDLEELLAPNRNALPFAQEVFDAFKNTEPQLLEDPHTSFLRGRLAWQSIQVSNDNYYLDDVIRYWKTAVDGNQESVTYLSALGFAYYQNQEFNRAMQTWTEAFTLAEIESSVNDSSSVEQARLNINAGLALGFRKLLNTATEQQIQDLDKEYNKLCNMVVNGELLTLQPENLSQNWLWTEQAIQDWQTTRIDCEARN